MDRRFSSRNAYDPWENDQDDLEVSEDSTQEKDRYSNKKEAKDKKRHSQRNKESRMYGDYDCY